MARGFISPQGASNLSTYQYNGVDQSIIANLIMKHYWNWLIDHVVPTWVAPNVLTLCGLICVVSGYLIMHYHCPSFGTPCTAPNWTYLALAGAIFAYQTFDNLDGKQARKTGSSSALGEVFDHGTQMLSLVLITILGTDSICLPLLSITLGFVFQLGPWTTYLSLIMMMSTFILAHWEGYFIHKLILRPIANPTEIQLITISTLLITAYKGPLFWLDQVSLPVIGFVQIRYLVLAGSVWGAVSTCFDNMNTVRKFCKNNNLGFKQTLLFLVPFWVLVIFSTIWAVTSPEVLYIHTREFLLCTGFLFSYITIRGIVQAVCKEPFKLYYDAMTPLVIVTLLSVISWMGTTVLLDPGFVVALYLFLVTILLANLAVTLISEFCYYLDIRPFTIQPKIAPG